MTDAPARVGVDGDASGSFRGERNGYEGQMGLSRHQYLVGETPAGHASASADPVTLEADADLADRWSEDGDAEEEESCAEDDDNLREEDE